MGADLLLHNRLLLRFLARGPPVPWLSSLTLASKPPIPMVSVCASTTQTVRDCFERLTPAAMVQAHAPCLCCHTDCTGTMTYLTWSGSSINLYGMDRQLQLPWLRGQRTRTREVCGPTRSQGRGGPEGWYACSPQPTAGTACVAADRRNSVWCRDTGSQEPFTLTAARGNGRQWLLLGRTELPGMWFPFCGAPLARHPRWRRRVSSSSTRTRRQHR